MRDYKKEFKEKCINCDKCNLQEAKVYNKVPKAPCSRLHYNVELTDNCYQFREDPLKTNNYIDNIMYKLSKSGCYITTFMTKILGMEDDCDYLRVFRKFRNEYMLTFDEGIKHLAAYDVYGYEIAEKLEEDLNDEVRHNHIVRMVKEIYYPYYLSLIYELICQGEYATAMDFYIKMTMMLAKKYNVDYHPIDVDLSQIDINTLGHARKRCELESK